MSQLNAIDSFESLCQQWHSLMEPVSREAPWWHGPEINPALRDWQSLIEKMASEAKESAETWLFTVLGKLTEHPEIRASICGLFLRLHNDELRLVSWHNQSATDFGENGSAELGIVKLVADTGKSYYSPDVNSPNERHYVSYSPNTKSELAVPLIWEGEVLAVINFESHSLDAFGDKARYRIAKAIPSLIPELLVLRSLLSEGDEWCPWHPEVHGWDMTRTLTRFCRHATMALEPAKTKLAIWYPDWEKNTAFVYAAYGYDLNYQGKDCVKLDLSCLDFLSENGVDAPFRIDPRTSPLSTESDRQKARDLEIDCGYAVKIMAENGADVRPIVAMTCLFCGDGEEIDAVEENARAIAIEALAGFKWYLQRFIASYRKQRIAVAKAQLNRVIQDNQGVWPGASYEAVLQQFLKFFSSPAGTVFRLSDDRLTLKVAATTGFISTETGGKSYEAEGHSYDLEEHRNSHTVQTLRMNGAALRRNSVGNSQEQGLPIGVPVVSTHKNAEFICNEQDDGLRGRRYLGCAVRWDGKSHSVIRMTRPSDDRAFTAFDAYLMEQLCEFCLPQIEPHRVRENEFYFTG